MLITRGFVSSTIITRGFGRFIPFRKIVEVLRFVSTITKTLFFESKPWK